MPSPFPGMDPFIEAQVWEDFHTEFNTAVRALLSPDLPAGYVASVETRVTISDPIGNGRAWGREPDVFAAADEWAGGGGAAPAAAVVDTVETEYELRDGTTEHYLAIRDARNREVVTVIETLSPENKRPSAEEPTRHELRRLEILRTEASLVEIDLLRWGVRPPTIDPLPATDYAVFVSRSWRRPRIEVVPIPLLQRLPVIEVPLREADGPVPLDLQAAVDAAYERGFYHRQIRYDEPIRPPLPGEALALLTPQ